ncbi:MAG: TAT-variant-translocated molybdopterin oxidoreductase [Pirellulaceae bacterium]
MKKHLALPIVEAKPAANWWRTLEELSGDDSWRVCLEREFPPDADEPSASSRRDFMRLMAASLLLAGASGCEFTQPREKIVPSARLRDFAPPGGATFFATAMDFAGCAVGLTVETRDGRPIKVEGNRMHPSSLGATGVFQQAATLDLYDPDRLRVPLHEGNLITLEAVRKMLAELADQCDDDQGESLSIVIGTTTSPTVRRLLDEMVSRWPKARWSAVNAFQTYGQTASVHDLSKATSIVSVEADFLGARDWPPVYIRQYADARRIVGSTNDQSMVRLFSLASTPSLTSAKADHSLSVAPS